MSYTGSPLLCERIENAVGVGRLDVNGCIDGATFDLELKAEERLKRASTKISFKVRVSQVVWMHERISAGCGTAWIHGPGVGKVLAQPDAEFRAFDNFSVRFIV